MSPRPRQPVRKTAAPASAAAGQGDNIGRQVGAAARRMRVAQGLTLAEVAANAGISQPMLSRLETGDVSPSLDTLASLARALGTSLTALFRDGGSGASDAQFVRKGEGLEVVRRGTRRGHTYHLLAADRGPRRSFEPFLVTLTDKSEVFPEFEHPGIEFIYLLEGSLSYRHGDESFVLRPGDALTFRGDVAHGPDKLIRLPVRMLSVIIYTPPAPEA